jgi:hypothetical protein
MGYFYQYNASVHHYKSIMVINGLWNYDLKGVFSKKKHGNEGLSTSRFGFAQVTHPKDRFVE